MLLLCSQEVSSNVFLRTQLSAQSSQQQYNNSRKMRLVSPAARPGRAYRPAVRVVSVVCALCFMYLYSHSRTLTITADNGVGSMGSVLVPKRQLLSYSENQQFGNNGNGGDSDNDDNDGDDTNCTLPRTHKNYNDSCSFVLELCQDQFQLFNYLEFILCDMSVHIQVYKNTATQGCICRNILVFLNFYFMLLVARIHNIGSMAGLSHLLASNHGESYACS